jgi:6-phosphogluconate dehydrogenase
MPAPEIAELFASWNDGELRSYLIEITARVLERVDTETGKPLVDLILDEAQQKGTGKWMSQNAFDVGAPIPTVNAAVEARLLSALKTERVAASRILPGPSTSVAQDFSPATELRAHLISATRRALYAAKIISYAQGMALLRLASQEYKYDIDPAEVAKIWRAGCIIRAALLSDVRAAFSRNPALVNLMRDESFANALASTQQALRDVVQQAVAAGIPVPALSSSLAYYDSYRTARLPANLTQGQRDFFGAHTYRRIDRDGVFHTDWIQA